MSFYLIDINVHIKRNVDGNNRKIIMDCDALCGYGVPLAKNFNSTFQFKILLWSVSSSIKTIWFNMVAIFKKPFLSTIFRSKILPIYKLQILLLDNLLINTTKKRQDWLTKIICFPGSAWVQTIWMRGHGNYISIVALYAAYGQLYREKKSCATFGTMFVYRFVWRRFHTPFFCLRISLVVISLSY